MPTLPPPATYTAGSVRNSSTATTLSSLSSLLRHDGYANAAIAQMLIPVYAPASSPPSQARLLRLPSHPRHARSALCPKLFTTVGPLTKYQPRVVGMCSHFPLDSSLCGVNRVSTLLRAKCGTFDCSEAGEIFNSEIEIATT